MKFPLVKRSEYEDLEDWMIDKYWGMEERIFDLEVEPRSNFMKIFKEFLKLFLLIFSIYFYLFVIPKNDFLKKLSISVLMAISLIIK